MTMHDALFVLEVDGFIVAAVSGQANKKNEAKRESELEGSAECEIPTSLVTPHIIVSWFVVHTLCKAISANFWPCIVDCVERAQRHRISQRRS